MGLIPRQSTERYIRLGLVCLQMLTFSACLNPQREGPMTQKISCFLPYHVYSSGSIELPIAELTRGKSNMGWIKLDLGKNILIFPETTGVIIESIVPEITSNSIDEVEVPEKITKIAYGSSNIVITQGFNQETGADFITCKELTS